jgi:hypothetical protein
MRRERVRVPVVRRLDDIGTCPATNVGGAAFSVGANNLRRRIAYSSVRVCVRSDDCSPGLCQNCVRYPSKPGANTVICGDMPMHIVVAGSRWW